MSRIIDANVLDILQTWVDTSYAIHQDMTGYTGGVMSMGRGIIHSTCSNQKLNTKCSTKTEVEGASDYIPRKVWAKCFL